MRTLSPRRVPVVVIESVFGTYYDVRQQCFEDVQHPIAIGDARRILKEREMESVAAVILDDKHRHRLVEVGEESLSVVYYTLLEEVEVGMNLPDGYRVEWRELIDYVTDAYGEQPTGEMLEEAVAEFNRGPVAAPRPPKADTEPGGDGLPLVI